MSRLRGQVRRVVQARGRQCRIELERAASARCAAGPSQSYTRSDVAERGMRVGERPVEADRRFGGRFAFGIACRGDAS